jgi:hypothetical protein
LFAGLVAVLPGGADGVFAFLGETGIVADPSGDGLACGHLGQNAIADGLEEALVIPGRYDDVMGSSFLRSAGHEEAGAVAG